MLRLSSIRLLALGSLLTFIVSNAAATQGNESLAQEAQNPLANMISLPFQNNLNTGIGPNHDQTQNILNIQPVIPISLNANWNLITRTIVPVISQPDFYTGDGRVNGVQDTTVSTFFSPAKSKEIIWGVGPMFLLPTSTDQSLGADKWGAGVTAAGVLITGHWVIGSLFSNVWSIGGPGNNDVNLFTWQYFINYNLPNAWYVTSAPIITADWEAKSGNQWTVPFGGGVGKIIKIGKQPINTSLHAYKNVTTPEDGAEWQFRFQVQFLFPE